MSETITITVHGDAALEAREWLAESAPEIVQEVPWHSKLEPAHRTSCYIYPLYDWSLSGNYSTGGVLHTQNHDLATAFALRFG